MEVANADRLGASLTAVLGSFEERTSALRGLFALRGLGPDAFPALERAELLLTSLEGDVSAARGAIMSEAALLTEAAELRRRAARSSAEVASLTAALPALLPGDVAAANEPATRPPLQTLGAGLNAEAAPAEEAAPPPPPSTGGRTPSRLPSARGTRSSKPPPPQMALVTEAELGSAPSYMKSRLDVSKVNAALMEFQKALGAKYAILHTPASQLRTLAESDRKRHSVYKSLQTDEVRGMYFISEEDLKSVHAIKNDATGKNLIAVLRHVGRIKEFKHGGMRCWQTRV